MNVGALMNELILLQQKAWFVSYLCAAMVLGTGLLIGYYIYMARKLYPNGMPKDTSPFDLLRQGKGVEEYKKLHFLRSLDSFIAMMVVVSLAVFCGMCVGWTTVYSLMSKLNL